MLKNRLNIKYFLFLILAGQAFMSSLMAQNIENIEAKVTGGTSAPNPHNYNLEGVVIEGRKSKVDTLVDLKDFNVEIEEVMFSRTNFDDYFEVDIKLRPYFAK